MYLPVFFSLQIYFHVYPCTVENLKAGKTAIVVELCTRRTTADIAAFNKLRKNLWYQGKKKFAEGMAVEEKQDNVSVSRKIHKKRREAIKKPKFVKRLQNMMDKDCSISIRSLGWEMNADENSV